MTSGQRAPGGVLAWTLGVLAVGLGVLALALVLRWWRGVGPYGLSFGVVGWRVVWALSLSTALVLLACVRVRRPLWYLGALVAGAVAIDVLVATRTWLLDVTGWPERQAVQSAERLARKVCKFTQDTGRVPTDLELATLFAASGQSRSCWTKNGQIVEFTPTALVHAGPLEALGGQVDVGVIACAIERNGEVRCVVGVPGTEEAGPRLARDRTDGRVAIAEAHACRPR